MCFAKEQLVPEESVSRPSPHLLSAKRFRLALLLILKALSVPHGAHVRFIVSLDLLPRSGAEKRGEVSGIDAVVVGRTRGLL